MTFSFKNRILRIALLLLTFALVLPLLLTACSDSAKPVKPSEQDIKVIGTCGGYDVYYEELRYVTMVHKMEFESRYGKGIWDDPTLTAKYRDQLIEEVSYALTVNYAILTMAESYRIDINDEKIQESVQEDIEAAIEESGGRAAYLKDLESLYMTDHFVRFTLAADKCETEICYTLMDLGLVIDNETDFLPYALNDENYCATYNVFIGNDPGDDVEENRKTAELVLEKLKGGASFESMIGSKYNEDVMEVNTPYYFTHGEYDEAYEKAAFALEIGEYSDIVETDDGFYIIWRQPLNESYIVRNATTLMQCYQYAEVESLLNVLRESLTIEWNEYGKSLDLTAMQ